MFPKFAAALLMSSALLAPAAQAADDDAKQAQALLAKAVAYYKDKQDLALGAFSRQGEFLTPSLYVYVLDSKGTMLASGGSSAALIDRNVADMKDAAGKPFFREMLDVAKTKGGGAVEYRWLNRRDGKVERKLTYFEQVKDRIIAVGYYLPHGSAEQARALVERAAAAVKEDPAKAIAAFNELNGSFSEDDLYVFAIGLDDKRFKAHGAIPRLVGSDALALRDADGKPFIEALLARVKDKDQGEIDYAWRNTVTSKVERKHTLLRKVGGLVVAVGYYPH